MSEKHLNTHYEKLVGSEKDINYMELESHFDECIFNDDGILITDPKEILKRIYNEGVYNYKEHEIEKTAEDKELITTAKDSVIDFAKHYGKQQFADITDNHIHLFKEGEVKKFSNGRLEVGSNSAMFGEVLIERRSNIETIITAFHELWHRLGSYSALQVTKDGMLENYRTGLGVWNRENADNKYLDVVDEAVTGYMTKRFFEEVVCKDEKFTKELEALKESGEEVDTSRTHEVERFLEYVDLLYTKNNTKFNTKEEIIDIFVTAQVTGNLLPLARLVDKTFGKGALRKLPEGFNK